jgi:hypothetical protein
MLHTFKIENDRYLHLVEKSVSNGCFCLDLKNGGGYWLGRTCRMLRGHISRCIVHYFAVRCPKYIPNIDLCCCCTHLAASPCFLPLWHNYAMYYNSVTCNTVDWLIMHKVGALIRVCIMNKYALPVVRIISVFGNINDSGTKIAMYRASLCIICLKPTLNCQFGEGDMIWAWMILFFGI